MQSWRTTEFADEHEDAIVTVMLEDTDEGALLILVHWKFPTSRRATSRAAGSNTISSR